MEYINNLEVRLITDNIYRMGDYREKEILKSLVKIELLRNDDNYKIYHFEDKEGNYFEYNFRYHTITN